MGEIEDRPMGIFRLTVELCQHGIWVATIRIVVSDMIVFTVDKNTERSARYAASAWMEKQKFELEKGINRLDSEYADLKPTSQQWKKTS